MARQVRKPSRNPSPDNALTRKKDTVRSPRQEDQSQPDVTLLSNGVKSCLHRLIIRYDTIFVDGKFSLALQLACRTRKLGTESERAAADVANLWDR